MNESVKHLEDWLDEDPETNFAEMGIGRTARWGVRLCQMTANTEDHPFDRRCVGDAEAATFEGAIEGALLLAREFKEGT